MSALAEQNTEVAEVRAPKPPIVATDRGLQLSSMEDMYRFAQYVVDSGFAPKGVDTVSAALVAIQMGFEIGLSPMQAIQNIAVINGRPSVWGDAVKALVLASGQCTDFREWFEGDGDTLTAWCEINRRGYSPTVRSFSVGDAKTADLSKKAGPWQQYPKRMLQMRARSWACRDAFPDALKGLLVAEEARDMEPIDVTPVTPKREVLAIDIQAIQNGEAPAPEASKASASDSPQPKAQKKTTAPAAFDRAKCIDEISAHAQRVGIDKFDDAVVKLAASSKQSSGDVAEWNEDGLNLLLAFLKAQK